jgi:hypothetical protein
MFTFKVSNIPFYRTGVMAHNGIVKERREIRQIWRLPIILHPLLVFWLVARNFVSSSSVGKCREWILFDHLSSCAVRAKNNDIILL